MAWFLPYLYILAALPSPAIAMAEPLVQRIAPCLACHGDTGTSVNEDVPSLGAQQPAYTLIQLYLFRERIRILEIMNEVTKDLSDDDLRAFSAYLAKLPRPVAIQDGNTARMQRGRELATKNRCASCHNDDLAGRDNIPRIGGQREDYLARTMREYRTNSRRGYDATMADLLQTVTDEEIADIAFYIARRQ